MELKLKFHWAKKVNENHLKTREEEVKESPHTKKSIKIVHNVPC